MGSQVATGISLADLPGIHTTRIDEERTNICGLRCCSPTCQAEDGASEKQGEGGERVSWKQTTKTGGIERN